MKPLHRAICIAIAAIVICGVGAGCTSVQRPTATFKTMNVTGITPTGFTMAFDLDMHNPNAVALPLAESDYKLAIGGVDVVEGKAKPEGAIPANGDLAVTLPVTVTYENLLAAERGLRAGGGRIPYAFTGQIGVSGGKTWLGQPPSVPIEYKGTLDLKSLLSDPQTLMKSPAAKRLAQRLLSGWFGR